MAEAEVVEWHVKVGDAVREDQVVAAVMTDKATVEIPSPADGTVTALGAEAGQVLSVGAELLRMEIGGDEAGSAPESGVAAGADVKAAESAAEGADASDLEPAAEGLEPRAPPPPMTEAPKPAPEPKRPPAAQPAPHPAPRAASSGPPRLPGEKPIASPAVRRRALEAGVDLSQVRGSGPARRISHDDLDAFLRGGVGPAPSGRSANTAVEEVRVIGLRRRIAQRMADAKRRAAHFSYVEEVDVTALEELRTTLNARYGATRPKLTVLPFLVQALVRTAADFPQINALYDDETQVVHRYAGLHVGIATQTPSGLMVPVLRHAEARDLWDCAAEIRRLTDSARQGLAARDELTGSTITITSLGALGGIASTPVLNLPEVAILGVNKQIMRPMWRDGAFVPRLTMNLSSSFDHRVVDGYDAALFVQAIKGLLETPAMLFVEP